MFRSGFTLGENKGPTVRKCRQAVRWQHFPAVDRDEAGRQWLQFMADSGRAPNTVDANGRALQHPEIPESYFSGRTPRVQAQSYPAIA